MTRVTTATVRGPRHAKNQDAFLVRRYRRLQILAVADGIGGGVGGEIASRTALQAFADELQRQTDGGTPLVDAAAAAIWRASAAVVARASPPRSRRSMMATTLTAVCIRDGESVLVHAGDSRAYLWRRRRCSVLTEDHSVTGELVRAGAISAARAERHEHRHILTQAVGAPGLRPQVASLALQPGDVLLLCTDGVHKALPQQRLADLAADSSGAVAERVVRAAEAAGTPDDATAVAGQYARGRSGMLKWVAVLAVLAVLIGATAALGRFHFLGLAGDRVTLFRGLPYTVAGVPLHRPQRIFATSARDLPGAYRDRLASGVRVRDEGDAVSMLQQMPREAP